MKALKTAIILVGVSIVIAGGLFVIFGPKVADNMINHVAMPGPYTASESAMALYKAHPKVDLHGDALLWERDLADHNAVGMVDFPRLFAADQTLAVMGVVSKVPMGQNFDRNPSDSDMLTYVVALSGWPVRTWFSLKERALYQAAELQSYADASEGQIIFVKNKSDLSTLLARKAAGEKVVGTLLGLEGLQVLEGNIANLQVMFDAGVRMAGLTHFFDNEVAGSAHGWDKGGLTDLGRAVVREMEQMGMIIDLAHVSPAAVDEVLAMATRPLVVSHTGVKGTCPGPRNLSDDHLRKIAALGGVIGVGYFEGAVCDMSPGGIARAIAHAVSVMGADHVGLGSDFDGAVVTEFDITGVPMLVDAMRDEGLSDPQIGQILGENALRVMAQVLPE